MFPLQSTLFPHQLLPLHIFEPRYRTLMADLAEADEPMFGVTLIERGREVGGGDTRTSVGTLARLVDTQRFDDGRWAAVAVGVERIEVIQWLDDNPYPLARTRPRNRADTGGGSLDDLQTAVVEALRLSSGVEQEHSFNADPLVRLDSLSGMAPLNPHDKQRVLEAETTTQQIKLLAELVAEKLDLLRSLH